jgi:hypothetical protein
MMTMTDLSKLSREELEAMVLRQQQATQRKLTLKVSEKGAVSLYGMGRFPVTLYVEQWGKLLDHAVTIREFIKDNQSLLSTKPDKVG